MKKMILLIAFLVSALPGTAMAVPQYYTFAGAITNISDNGFGTGFGVGDSVTYTFLVDRAADGYQVSNGTTLIFSDDPGIEEVYYAQYIAGSAITSSTSDQRYSVNENQLYNQSILNATGPGAVNISNTYNNLSISGLGLFSTWSAGMTGIHGSIFAWDKRDVNNFRSVNIRSILTLTSISDTAPVPAPEPGTLLLLGSGLVGLVVMRKGFGLC